MTKYFHPEFSKIIFPIYSELFEYSQLNLTRQLFISDDERTWANEWLVNHGLKNHEDLFIVLDSTSNREKLIGTDVYNDLLAWLFENENIKILNFDESNLEKAENYKKILSEDEYNKFIFSKNLTLREAICLMSSNRTKMIFGPCTGLMHCASHIYNNFAINGLSLKDIPLIIVYTGNYGGFDVQVDFWWADSPLVNCLIIRKTGDIVLLNDLSIDEKSPGQNDNCSAYTSVKLISSLKQVFEAYRTAIASPTCA